MLPFLNAGSAFAPALLSIQNQTYQNWELLLCDDGSKDGSLELAQSINDPRIKVWSDSQSKGLAARLNECITKAQGPLIARMDADDISYPDRIERQVAFLQSHPNIDLLGCQMLICGEDGEPFGKRRLPLEHHNIIASPALGFGLAHPTWMVRAAWYRQHLYDSTALRFEDVELLYRSYKTSQFANLPEILYGYREMRGGLKKRFKTRLGRVKYLNARSQNRSTAIKAAAAECIKVAADAVLTTTGSRYKMLRRREEPLTPQELATWNQVLNARPWQVEVRA